MKFVKVNAPFVNLKVKDAAGAWTVQGMYEGAMVAKDNVDADSLQHHLETEFALRDGKTVTMVEVVDGPKPEPAAVESAPEPAKEPDAADKKAPAKKSASA